MSEQLKPCRMCGGTASYTLDDDGFRRVICDNYECRIQTKAFYNEVNDLSDAEEIRMECFATWNRTAPDVVGEVVMTTTPDTKKLAEELKRYHRRGSTIGITQDTVEHLMQLNADLLTLMGEMREALDYWTPVDEPYNPHTRNKAHQFKNMKWGEACGILARTEPLKHLMEEK